MGLNWCRKGSFCWEKIEASTGVITSSTKIELTGVDLPHLAALAVSSENATPLEQLRRAPTLGQDGDGNLFAAVPIVPDGC